MRPDYLTVFYAARDFAEERHKDQKYGPKPYLYHLSAVASYAYVLVMRYATAEEVGIAGWLHDTLEDTKTTVDELKERFGEKVAKLVVAVTDEPGRNRKERAKRTLPKIRAAGKDAVGLKLADRVANVEACIDGVGNIDLIKMYRKEYPAFKEALYEAGEFDPIWKRLDLYLGDPLGRTK